MSHCKCCQSWSVGDDSLRGWVTEEELGGTWKTSIVTCLSLGALHKKNEQWSTSTHAPLTNIHSFHRKCLVMEAALQAACEAEREQERKAESVAYVKWSNVEPQSALMGVNKILSVLEINAHVCLIQCHAGAGQKGKRAEVEYCSVLRCEEAVGGRGGSAVEIIPGFCPKSCARWADQGPREEWCYPVAVTQPRAFHLTGLAALQPAGLEAQPSTSIRSCHTATAKSGWTDFEPTVGVAVS